MWVSLHYGCADSAGRGRGRVLRMTIDELRATRSFGGNSRSETEALLIKDGWKPAKPASDPTA
jgi:hypothetical protein